MLLILVLFLSGVATWTLIEYLLHRFVFHLRIGGQALRGWAGSFHTEHHAAPRDRRYLFVRPPWAIGISALLALPLWAATGNLVQTMSILAGIWTGFVYYESVHYRVHFTASERTLIGRQRRAHFRHHFHDSRRDFGVTSPVWDYVFRTRGPSGTHSDGGRFPR